MAMVNARIDDDLKARVDAVLQRRNITVTQNMTDLYRYIDQHEQSPFLPAPRPHTADEVVAKCCSDLMNIRDALLLIRGHAERQAGSGEMASLYQLFTRSRLAFADGLCWLHSAPALPLTVDRLLLPLAHAQAQIAECDIALGGGSRDALVLTGEREQHLSTAIASLDELVSNLCQKAGLLRRQVPVVQEEQRADGEFCTAIAADVTFPGDIDVTVLLRPDLLRLLTPRLKEAIPCPRLPGWQVGVDISSGYNTFITAPADSAPVSPTSAFARAASGGAMGSCGLLFIQGETRIHYWQQKDAGTDVVPRDKLAEAVCEYMDSLIGKILQGAVTEKGE
ncbi:hypothetical protein ACK3RO_004645 [Enterobacter kobei]|uniref:hypothetical protein n=1 Tax=Enterobacter cloacae complex TaxID=354276 RepID=UPI0003BE7826|nr:MULTISPECIES: hypothetical protein [Enterobacter cloacae complex]ELE9684023.1 hypothetical protein [Enterobacter kobei]MDU5045293.1 hypothetical protein [Enterobacter roggenkampii]ESN20173.1 hypothetical protein L369_04714 [Enterobacter sp. MGH 23]KZP91007.1 hypothetical protein A3463_08720 [Enterobacter chengduensis]MDK9986013.1 hypothetical protein [Enterobacter asburiae]